MPTTDPRVDAYVAAALAASAPARATFEGFAPSHRREYLEWIVEAKRPETRPAHRAGRGMDGGGEGAALEVRAVLGGAPGGAA